MRFRENSLFFGTLAPYYHSYQDLRKGRSKTVIITKENYTMEEIASFCRTKCCDRRLGGSEPVHLPVLLPNFAKLMLYFHKIRTFLLFQITFQLYSYTITTLFGGPTQKVVEAVHQISFLLNYTKKHCTAPPRGGAPESPLPPPYVRPWL